MISGPGWCDPIDDEEEHRNPGPVEAALLTTYDLPDAALLIEDLFPKWFSLDREPSNDDQPNHRFFLAELEAALRRRHGRISVFATPDSSGDGERHWLWSLVGRHFVGARGGCVQHAKLWLLHRVDAKNVERLDIRVSSANLSRSAFREQVQAGFRLVLSLGARTNPSRVQSWGSLVPFLRELGSHSGPSGELAVKPWIELLGRCECPDDVEFIASVPGKHSGHQWGSRALGKALNLKKRSEVDVFVPTVGHWTDRRIMNWARAVGTLPDRVRLAWVREGHPWATSWQLPSSCPEVFTASGVKLLALDSKVGDERRRIHGRFTRADDRWPHAKVYWFEERRGARVLVTSANWSPSAWGVETGGGQTRIRNFELGVLLPAEERPLQTLKEFTGGAATVEDVSQEGIDAIWTHATFDGRRLTIQLEAGEVAPRNLVILDTAGKELARTCRWLKSAGIQQSVLVEKWTTRPAYVALVLGTGRHWICVQDIRDAQESVERPLACPPGMSEEELNRLRAMLLEERYGGRIVEDALGPEDSVTQLAPTPGMGTASAGTYSVWILDEARRVLAVLDNWQTQLDQAESLTLRKAIEQDGRQLLRLWNDEISHNSRRSIPLAVACDELSIRLSGLP